jgi:hypothetical protein
MRGRQQLCRLRLHSPQGVEPFVLSACSRLDRTDRDKEETTRLEDEMKEAERALMRHQTEHGCRG